jgi:hypothetical protein
VRHQKIKTSPLGGKVADRFSERNPTYDCPASLSCTRTVLDKQNTQHCTRLDRINVPEKAQLFGTESREYLAGKVFGKTVRVEVVDVDRYRREVGRIRQPFHVDTNGDSGYVSPFVHGNPGEVLVDWSKRLPCAIRAQKIGFDRCRDFQHLRFSAESRR